MKSELDRSKASFKLDLIETANADPMLMPADLKLLIAYISVMAWPSCKTWLAPSLGMAMTGLSHGQFWKSRALLQGRNEAKRAYLLAARNSGKVARYSLVNPWRDEARAHVAAMTGYFQEADRQKKEQKRANRSLQNLEGREGGCPSKIWSPVPPKFGGYTPLMMTPRKRDAGDENRDGSNPELMNDNRQSVS